MNAPRHSAVLLLLSSALASAHPEHAFLTGLSAPSPATVLLVTAPELEEAWEPFAAWKKKLGRPVRILTTQQIDDRYEAPDLQEKIRRCVRNHTDHLGTRWVILGGDSEPGGKGPVPHRDVTPVPGQTLPADIFYLSKKDWDADNDGVFGEWEDDRDSIAYPDGEVGLGRIPVRTPADVAAYTEKVIAYESRYPEGDFATTMLFTCPEPSAYPKLRTSWNEHISKSFPEGNALFFLADESPWDETAPGDHELSPENWLKLFDDRVAGKMHLHGHGLLSSWILEDNEKVTLEDLSQLKNENAYPVITTVSCFTGQFDAEDDPSIAEALLRQPKSGAILVAAPIREGKPHFHNPKEDLPLMIKEGKLDGTTRTMTEFWVNALRDDLSAGAAMMMVKYGMISDAEKSPAFHLCQCELNLLGDPTLPLRSKAPTTPAVATPKTLPPGSLSLVIESDAPGAIVSLIDTHGLYAVQIADETGDTTFPLSLAENTTVTVTVSGSDLNAVSLEIPVK